MIRLLVAAVPAAAPAATMAVTMAAAMAMAAMPAAAVPELPPPPGATALLSERDATAGHALPVAPFDGETVPLRPVAGPVTRRSWRVPAPADAAALMAPLRRALTAAGYRIVLDCAGAGCGGADFLFAVETVAAPDMYVNLRDFRFLAALGADGGAVSVLVSVFPSAGYVQIVTAAGDGSDGSGSSDGSGGKDGSGETR